MGVVSVIVVIEKDLAGFVDVEEMHQKLLFGGEEEHVMLHAMYDAGDEVEMCFDADAAMSLLDEESGVRRESDVDEEGEDNEDGLDQEIEEGDLDVEVVEGDVQVTEVYNGVAGLASGTATKVQKLLPKEESNGGGHGTLLSGVGTVQLTAQLSKCI
jgi:hypothetical protein